MEEENTEIIGPVGPVEEPTTIYPSNEEVIDDKAEEPVAEPESPTPEQIAFDELVEKMGELQLEKDDIVIFYNNQIGRIDGIFISKEDLMYRIYVKVTNDMIITLNELFKDMTGDVNYNAVKVISKDFTNTKVEVEIEEIVLTKEQAQEELSSLKGQTVIIE